MTDVVSNLARNLNGFSRVRESKLTYFLKDSLGGNAFIMVVACISLDSQVMEDTLRTIEFARNVKNIKIEEVKKNDIVVIDHNFE